MTGNPFPSDEPNKFIVIDDDSINNIVSRFTILRFNKNSDIQLFTSSEAALEVISEMADQENNDSPTIILLDINMPVLNGWDFLDGLAGLSGAMAEKFNVYMLSSSIDGTDMEKSEKHTLVSGFFSKPLTENHLRIIFGDLSRVAPHS